jgi:hypothetical protein
MKTRNKLAILALIFSTALILTGFTTSRAGGLSPLATNELIAPRVIQGSVSSAPGGISLIDEQTQYPLGLGMDILEDPDGKLTIEEVSSPAFDTQFASNQVAVPNYGYTESVYWVRLTFDNQTMQTHEWLLEDGFANTHYVDLYIPLTDGNGFEVRQTGALRPVSWDIPYPTYFSEYTTQSHDLYLRFQSGSSMTIPLTLWTKDAFIVKSGHSLILHWLLFGGFLALLVYHLFLLYSVREIIYLYFVVMITAMLTMLLEYTGYLSVYIIPSLYSLKSYFIPVIVSVMYISIILFSDKFLELKTRIPELHWANLFMLAVWVGLLILTPFISYLEISRLMTPWQLITIGLTWVIGIAAWRKGAPPTRFFMFDGWAWQPAFFCYCWFAWRSSRAPFLVRICSNSDLL